jgi:hypothetical protein
MPAEELKRLIQKVSTGATLEEAEIPRATCALPLAIIPSATVSA